MADRFSAGLADQDDLSQFPSAANPLTAMGIDPDEARANPSMLAQLHEAARMGGGVTPPAAASAPAPPPGRPVPGTEDEPPAQPPVSAQPTTHTQTPASPQTADDYEMAGLSSLNRNASMATDAAAIPTDNPEVDRLTALREKLATPAPLYDRATGKTLKTTQEYDPTTGKDVSLNPRTGIGTKIWRGVRGGLVGFAEGGFPGALVGAIDPQDVRGGGAGYSAPSSAYTRGEQQRESELAATDSSLTDVSKNWKDAVDAAKAKAVEFRANAGLGKDETESATGVINAATNKKKEDNAANADANKLTLNQGEFDQRTQQVAGMPNLSPLQRTLYILNGKVPDPQQPNEAEINAAQAARALVVFRAQHGGKGPQTLEDFNQIQAAARGTMDKKTDADADAEVGSIVADATQAKQEYADKYSRNPDGSYSLKDAPYDPKTTVTAQQFQDGLEKFRTDANVKLAKKGHQIGPDGKLGSTAPTPTAQNAAPPPPVGKYPKGTVLYGRNGERVVVGE